MSSRGLTLQDKNQGTALMSACIVAAQAVMVPMAMLTPVSGVFRRHHRSPALARKPAGQDPGRAFGTLRGRTSDALFQAEVQSFLD
jgi:hypothetical protein